MSEPQKKLDIDLDFLDKNDSTKFKNPKEGSGSGKKDQNESGPVSKQGLEKTGNKYNWKTILVICGIVLFFGWAIFSGNNSSNNSVSDSTESPAAPAVNDQDTIPTTQEVDSVAPIVPIEKTDNQICVGDYGSHSYATGEKNANGGPVCDCKSGFTWDSTKTTCVVAPPPPKTGYEICQDRNGPYATYDSESNSCGCATGYYLGTTSEQCVSLVAARDESCSASYPGTSFLKYDTASGKNICDCKTGYYWNDEMTACYSAASFDQSCVNSYGTGSHSTTENGKRVCDCSYGYVWNPQRNSCVTVSSVNEICERDVGRNSRYAGSSSDGKYNCTEPY